MGDKSRLPAQSNFQHHAAARPLRLAIVTMSRARTQEEEACLTESLSRLSAMGLPIYVGEGGSRSSFVGRLLALSNVTVSYPNPSIPCSLVGQLRAAFARAAEIKPDYVVYTEPDKLEFFRTGLHRMLRMLAREVERGPAPGLVLASRSSRGMSTFPLGQQVAERYINEICAEALDQPGDYTYGPLILHRRLLEYMPVIPSEVGWGWRFFMIAVARQLRLPVKLCVVPNTCPRSQRGEDDPRARQYRLRQLEENVTGLVHGWTCLLDHELATLAA
jgi:hypothetical protein